MFENEIKEIGEEFGMGNNSRTGIYRMKTGQNRLRILKGGEKTDRIVRHYINKKYIVCFGANEGCPFHGKDFPRGQIQVGFFILDKSIKDPQIEPAFLSYSVYGALQTLSSNEDYRFTELPMMYDITINYDPNAAPNDKYKVIPSPKQEPVSAEILTELAKKDSLHTIIERMRAKAKGQFHSEEGAENVGEQLTPTKSMLPSLEDDEEIKTEEIPF